MKTQFRKLNCLFVAMIATCAATTVATAGNLIPNPVIGEDTFTLGTEFQLDKYIGDDGDGVTDDDDFQTVPQTRSVNSPLVNSYPELRELDRIHSFVNDPLSQTWKGSEDIIVGLDAGGVNGVAKRNSTPAGPRSVAYLETFRTTENGPGYPLANWEVQAKVNPGVDFTNSASIGWRNDLGVVTTSFRDGAGEIWGMLQDRDSIDNTLLNTNTVLADDEDHYGRFCLFVNGAEMLIRFDSLADSALVDGTSEYEPFPYNVDGYNDLYMAWDGEDDAITVKVNGYTLLNHVTLATLTPSEIDFDAATPFTQKADFHGVGFQLMGNAELDDFAATPEPSSMITMLLGMIFFGYHSRQNRRRARKLSAAGLTLMN